MDDPLSSVVVLYVRRYVLVVLLECCRYVVVIE